MTNSHVYKFDPRRLIALPGDSDQATEFAVKQFIKIAQDAIEKRGVFIVALSGGSTPKAIFEMLLLPKYREAINWGSVLLFWGDERAVPPTNPDSNYHMAMTTAFSKLPIPEKNIFRMEAEDEIEKHAKDYEEIIRKNVRNHSFDLVMLGMGPDGHTASLFPGTQALMISDAFVVANEVPQKSCWRMTFTFPLINAARNIVLYVMGDSKKERLVEVLMDETKSFPSQNIGTSEHPAIWIVDDAASALLLKVWKPKGNNCKKAG